MPVGRPAKSPERTQFGQRLYEARTEKGLSQADVASKLGITQPSYADWERKAVAIRPEFIPLLADTLDVSIDFLLNIGATKQTKSSPSGKLRRILDRAGELPQSQQQRIAAVIEDLIIASESKQVSRQRRSQVPASE